MNHYLTRLCLLGMLVFGLSAVTFGQRSITGKVIDAETNEPLIGATVLIKGSLVGTITDIDGDYLLEAEDDDVLVYSYVGFQEQEILVGTQSTIDVALNFGTVTDEVVVIGYGSVKQSDLTGSISKVGEEDFNKGAILSPEQLLDGRASGVQIVGSSGAPGAAARINIRGASSIRSGNDPLIVIDGIQLDNRSPKPGGDIQDLGRAQASNPFSFIDPNEIASIEVLKDASATAIYGSRGANGVILITTKKGQTGAPTVEYSVQQGISSILARPDYLDGGAYRAALASEGVGDANDFGGNVDALDEILTSGYTNSHNLSVSGGGQGFSYRVFGSAFDQNGIIDGTGITKYTGGAKGSFNILNDRVTLDVGLTSSNVTQEDGPLSDDAGFEGSLVGAALQWNPTRELTTAADSFDQTVLENRNPLAMLEYIKDQTRTNRTIGNIGATVNIAKGLDYRANFNFDAAQAERRAAASPLLNFNDIFGRGFAYIGSNRLGSIQYTHTLNYINDISDNIGLNLLGGYEYLKYTNKGTDIFVSDLAQDFTLDYTDILQSASNDNQRVQSFREPDIELQSYFARGILNISEKYLVTATVRADGSSKVGTNNTYGIFPSFAAAWNISNEDFAPDAFDNLKLRVGWGQTGNQEFPAGAAQEYFEYENGNLTQTNAANPDLKWETSTQLNVGLDFAFADYKVTGTIDFFNKQTEDLILFVPIAQPAPAGRVYRNVDGTITNTGVELGLNTYLVNRDNFTWDVGVNATYLSNKVEDFVTSINTGAINGQGLTGAFSQRIENGQPLFSYYLPVFTGINSEGLSEYEDPVNGGTTLIATVNSVKQHVGDPLPDFLLGVSTNAIIGNFNVQLNLNGAFGYEVYNNTANAVFVKGNLANGRNVTAEQVGNGESTNNSYPASTRYLESGDHLRLSNLTVGYSFENLPSYLSGLRLTLTGQNLFVISGYSGFDPIVNTNKQIEDIPSFGIEYTPYPTARTFLLGASIKF